MIVCARKIDIVPVLNVARRFGATLFLFLAVTAALPVHSQVVINEIVAASSDRQLQRAQTGYPKLGLTAPWYGADFDDSPWAQGNGPFGFGTFSGVTIKVDTSAAMQSKTPSLYVRKGFDVSVPQAASGFPLQLTVRYNDGFIAFLNGKEVARRNMGNPGMFAYRDQTAFNTNSLSALPETINLGITSNTLVAGKNLLCIQVHNKAVLGMYANNLLCMADLRIAAETPIALVTNTATWRYFVGAAEPSGGVIDYGLLTGVPSTAAWATLGFNDSSWPASDGPFGIESAGSTDFALGTNLYSQVYNKAVSIYSRTLFSATASEAASTNALQLILDYDDGVIVYLNGCEVARRNIGITNTITPHDLPATANHNADGDGGGTISNQTEKLTLGPANTLLASGYNVLAIQLHNSALGSSDMIARATLSTTGENARTLTRPDDPGRFFVGLSEPAVEDSEDESDRDDDTPDSEGDWIELYNEGSDPVNLTGWSLTDNRDVPRKWYFPAASRIPANGYLVVMATGYDVGPANGANYLHTNFKLSAGGEYLGLVNAAGLVVSEIAPAFPPQDAFHAYARNASGTFVYSDFATPGAANAGTLFSAITAAPAVSHLGGFYTASFPLQLTSPDPEAAIRYTLDGSEPTTATGFAYTAPLTIAANAVVRARCFKAGEIPSDSITHTYLIAQSAARRSLAAISFVGDSALAFYGPNATGGPANGEGIMAIKGGGYLNSMWDFLGDTAAFNVPNLRGRCSEKPVSFEFYPTNGIPLRTDLGLRISGSPWSRPRYKLATSPTAKFPADPVHKPSFNIFFRNELGESPRNYPFFPDSRVTKFGDIRIRAGKNDISNPFIRDELMRRIFIGTGQEGARGLFASVYINGTWKGYYNFCEHLREAFMQQHHNSTAAWDVRQVGDFVSGDSIHWNSMIAYLRTNNLTAATAFQGVKTFLDVDNYIDYLMVNIYGATWDWPNNNWVAARERSESGRWRFYMWDAEGAFGSGNGLPRQPGLYNIFIGDTNKDNIADSSEANYKLDIGSQALTTSGAFIPAIYTLLKVSPEFRLRFADRAQKHFFHGGCLTQGSMEQNFFALRDQINPIMKETINQYVNQTFYSNWISSTVRRVEVFEQFTKYGLWPAVLAPEFSQHGGEIATNDWVTITHPNSTGSIYFTTDGVDPRAPGGAAVGTLYAGPIRFPETAVLKARVLNTSGDWSPLQEATFTVPLNMPLFLPAVSADWAVNANWSTDPLAYPNGNSAAMQINAPPSANREVTLRVPVAIGSLTVNQGDTPYRNKIGDSGSTNTLTFLSTNATAALTVNGSGTGYVEFEVDSDVILGSDLTLAINNPYGNTSYGALRLKANWRGPGGLIKEGAGRVALTGESKSYTGPTVINQGVLQFTQPASPGQSVSVTVNPGGQLRLTSASTAGEPRLYTFGGTLTLNSRGRGGILPDDSSLGIDGGLRFDPESNDSIAVITNRIVFAGPSAIHVENARNTLELTSPLSGTYGFTKTGAGNLILPAFSNGYYVPVCVSNGTLSVLGRLVSPVEIATGATLTGCGRVGPIHGTGTVALDRVIFSSSTAIGLNYAFAFTTNTPAYWNGTASGNSVLRLRSLYRGAQAALIDIYLDVPVLSAGDRLRGGFFVECGNDLAGFLANAVVRFFEPSASGSQSFAGRLYAPYTGTLPLTLTAMPDTADFGDGPRQGLAMEIRVAGTPVRFSEWLLSNFPATEDLAAPSVSDPLATPYGGNTPNLLRYAFDIAHDEPETDKLPRFSIQNGTPLYRFHFDPGKSDLTYLVEAAPTLTGDWARVLFDSRNVGNSQLDWDGETLSVPDTGVGPALAPAQFYRLRIQLTEP